MDQANIIEFGKRQVWADRLIKIRVEEPPPGFVKPTMKQLQAADQKMFWNCQISQEAAFKLTQQDVQLRRCLKMSSIALL